MCRISLLVVASVLAFSMGAAAQDLSVSVTPSTPAGAAADPPAFKSGTEYPMRVGISYQFTQFRDEHGLTFHNNGINTDFTGYLGHDFAVEGDVAVGFGTAVFTNTNSVKTTLDAKSVFYAGGVRIGPERSRFQPWVHALIGGEHFEITQTSSTLGHNTGLGYELGAGADVKIGPRAFWRVEGDYLGTHIYAGNQLNYQISTGVAFSF
jgi:hypothetical protein